MPNIEAPKGYSNLPRVKENAADQNAGKPLDIMRHVHALYFPVITCAQQLCWTSQNQLGYFSTTVNVYGHFRSIRSNFPMISEKFKKTLNSSKPVLNRFKSVPKSFKNCPNS